MRNWNWHIILGSILVGIPILTLSLVVLASLIFLLYFYPLITCVVLGLIVCMHVGEYLLNQ